MKRPKIVIRADADPVIGMGHVVRCLALARELVECGAGVHLISKPLPQVLEEQVRELGLDVSTLGKGPEVEATLEILRRLAPVDVAIVDHYGLDEAWERAIRRCVGRLMVIDDLASRTHCCDFLLDQNYAAADVGRYQGLVPAAAAKWLGPSYALIRPDFSVARARRQEQKSAIRTILVSFGGFASPQLVLRVIEAFALPPLAGRFAGGMMHIFGAGQSLDLRGDYPFRVSEHRFPGGIASFLAESDLAIGAGGGGLWERLCVGVPSLVTILADNQRPGVEALAKDGYIVNLGEAGTLTAKGLSDVVRAVCDEPGMLHRLSERGRLLVDGAGACRVAEMLLQSCH